MMKRLILIFIMTTLFCGTNSLLFANSCKTPPGFPRLSAEQEKKMEQARQLLQTKKNQGLIEFVNQHQKSMEGPHAAELFLLKGQAYLGLGNKAKAKNLLNTALSIVNFSPPFDVRSHEIKAKAAKLLGDQEKLKQAQAAIEKCK